MCLPVSVTDITEDNSASVATRCHHESGSGLADGVPPGYTLLTRQGLL